MNSTRLVSTGHAIVLVVCVALALSGCAAAANYQITVLIEGPWAYTTTDPGHPGRFVLIGPVDAAGHNPPAAHHFDGWVELAQNPATYLSTLDIRNLRAPNARSCNTKSFPATISAKMFANVMSDTNHRYVVSLPLPDSCVTYDVTDIPTKIGTKWWIPPNSTATVTDGPFAVNIELTYTVTQLAGGFDLDDGHYAFAGTNQIEIRMSPNGNIKRSCDLDSRHAFGALVKVFSSKDGTNGTFDYYEDFRPFGDTTCLGQDDQNPNFMGNVALNNLSLPIKNLEAFIRSPQPSEQAKAREDLKALQSAVRQTHMHGAASLDTEMSDLDEFVKAPNSPEMSGKTDVFLKDLDKIFRLVDDGSGACRKAMINITVQ